MSWSVCVARYWQNKCIPSVHIYAQEHIKQCYDVYFCLSLLRARVVSYSLQHTVQYSVHLDAIIACFGPPDQHGLSLHYASTVEHNMWNDIKRVLMLFLAGRHTLPNTFIVIHIIKASSNSGAFASDYFLGTDNKETYRSVHEDMFLLSLVTIGIHTIPICYILHRLYFLHFIKIF